jgi:hypothetical protein
MMHQCLNGSCNEPKQKYRKYLKQRPVSTRNYFLAEKWGMAYNVCALRRFLAIAKTVVKALVCALNGKCTAKMLAVQLVGKQVI